MSNAPIPADLPAEAIGFVAVRPDRPERLALFRRDGTLSNSFAQDQDAAEVAAILTGAGFRVAGAAVFRDA